MLHFLCSFDKGPRAARGGLTGGWSAHSDGKILKIWGVRNNTHNLNHVYVKFPIEGRMVVNTMYVRMYLKIIRGKAAVQVSCVIDAWASVVRRVNVLFFNFKFASAVQLIRLLRHGLLITIAYTFSILHVMSDRRMLETNLCGRVPTRKMAQTGGCKSARSFAPI